MRKKTQERNINHLKQIIRQSNFLSIILARIKAMNFPAPSGVPSKSDSDFNVASDGEYDPERFKCTYSHLFN